MKKEEIEALFPITVEITEDILDEGGKNINNGTKCIGHLALTKALTGLVDDTVRISWGFCNGSIWVKEDGEIETEIHVTTTDKTSVGMIVKPTQRTFIVGESQILGQPIHEKYLNEW